MRILVTGAKGFIGREVITQLQQAHPHAELVGVGSRQENDLTHPYVVKHLLHQVNPQIIFHLAANPHVRPSDDDPKGLQLLDQNLLMTWHLARYAPDGCKFVFASSATVYGDRGVIGPCSIDSTCQPTSVYGVSKLAAEAILLQEQWRIKPIIARLVANVGENATHGLLPDLVRKLRRKGDMDLDLLGEMPGTIKPYFHVTHTVQWLLKLAVMPEVSLFHNIAPYDSLSVLRIAELVMTKLGHKSIRWRGRDSIWEGDNPHVRVVPTTSPASPSPHKSSEQAIRKYLEDVEC